MRIWIKKPLAILATAAENGLVVEDGVIAELLPAGREPAIPVDSIFDAREHVVLPGLINTHHHFYQTLTRAFGPALGKPLFPWLEALYPVWAGLRPEMLHTATELALAELLLSGCTTASDHHYVFPGGLEQAIDIQVEVASRLGIRTVLTRGSMSLGQDSGGLPPESVIQNEDAILEDSERIISRYHQTGPGSMTQIALAPCSPFSVSPELMRETAALARRHGVRLHTHLAETEDENCYCQDRFGYRPLDYLEDVGWLAGDVWLAHGIHFTSEEIDRLGKAHVGIAHCPSSNMLLGSGFCDARRLEAAGCPVGLGVDGSASNDCSNLMQEVRQAFLLQRVRYGTEAASHLDALRFGTRGSAACLGRDDIGTIAPGLQADLALFCLDELRFSGAGEPLAALVLCGAHRADRVMVAGRWVVADGTLPDVDLAELTARHREAATRLQTGN